ncbi:MAG TPA: hypothetical protein VE258_17495 [Ktedonobacterales bacterium]|jgi:hypothetical protein|nr:hypothetical protein [Ktedonobacterales bacterium]
MPSPTHSNPNQFALLLHIRKTFALVGAVLADPRVPRVSKAAFMTAIGALVLALVGADGASALVESLLPIVGPVLGLPADAAFDWIAFSVAAFNLLKLFPADIVGEHYDRLFRPARGSRRTA